jgi:hypothetical protein
VLRLRVTQREVRVEIRTSYWRLLARIDDWLDRLVSGA